MQAFGGDRFPRVGRSNNAISESRWAQRRGNFLSRPKEPHSDGGWRHIEDYTDFAPKSYLHQSRRKLVYHFGLKRLEDPFPSVSEPAAI